MLLRIRTNIAAAALAAAVKGRHRFVDDARTLARQLIANPKVALDTLARVDVLALVALLLAFFGVFLRGGERARLVFLVAALLVSVLHGFACIND